MATEDAFARQDGGWNISAVIAINGQEATQYLTELAALNSVGLVEPHADYNAMLYSPTQDFLYTWDLFSNGLTFFPGDTLNITFENGTEQSNSWLATYTVSDFTGPLTTGGDYYNYFVLGLTPASYNDVPLPEVFNYTSSSSDDGDQAAVSLRSWYNSTNGAYPADPFIVQDNLQLGLSGGVLTGYMIDDNQTAVLSIPSFNQRGLDTGNFSLTLMEFIATANKTSRVIIDLQGNTGGSIFLAFVTFRRFFPSIDPFAGSRRRSHELANILGESFTDYWNGLSEDVDDKARYGASEWVVTDRLNAATGANFSSWAEFFGPQIEHADEFTLVVRLQVVTILSVSTRGITTSIQYIGAIRPRQCGFPIRRFQSMARP